MVACRPPERQPGHDERACTGHHDRKDEKNAGRHGKTHGTSSQTPVLSPVEQHLIQENQTLKDQLAEITKMLKAQGLEPGLTKRPKES